MKEENFYVPVKVFLGPDAVRAHAKDFRAFGKKALIVTGRRSAKACGVYDDICGALDAEGIAHALFDGVEENPSAATVMKARDFGVEQHADFVIGAGGGSPMDAAKAIALMMAHKEEGRDYLYTIGADSSALPVVCVPTTCGTGSEVTAVSVLTDEVKGIKGSIPHKIFPSLALIDGKYLTYAGEQILCSTAFDALAHLIESWLNADAGTISRMIAEDGLREWRNTLPVLRKEKAPSAEDYETLMRAAMLGGMAIAHTGTSLPHALSYTLTYHLHVPHGRAVCYFLAGYLSEADQREAEYLLSLAGFSSVEALHGTYLSCCRISGIPEEEWKTVMEASVRAVSSNTDKCAKAPFPVDSETLSRIAGYADKHRIRAVLFDLDGTIQDSGPGILNSVRYSLEKMGAEIPPVETLRRFVGPSLVFSYTTYCGMSEEEAWKATEAYRECYHAGECYNLRFYDGIRQLLNDLKQAGVQTAIVTSKPQDMAVKILDHFDMLKYFDTVTGPDPNDSSNQKSVLINRALKELKLEPEEAVMVGDTRFDMTGAKEAGCACVGVTYGYGTREELEEYGADVIVDTPGDILHAIRSE